MISPAMPPASTTTREPIKGNTYPVRGELRALDGEWDGAARAWLVPVEHAKKAREIVKNQATKR